MLKNSFLATLIALSIPIFATNIVSNPSFETPNAGTGFSDIGAGGTMGAWIVGSGSVDIIGTFWQAANLNQSVDMNGDTAGTIYQDLTTVPSKTYRLKFAMAGNPYGYAPKTMKVFWGSQQVANLTFDYQTTDSPTHMRWRYSTFHVMATTTTTRLTFQSTTGAMNGIQGYTPWYGPCLDDVQVTLSPVGDVNGDGCVDDSDLLAVINSFLATSGMSNYNPDADLDANGIIDDGDLLQVINHFLQGC